MNRQHSAAATGNREPTLRLRCGNLRIAFLALSMVFWCFSLILLCQLLANSHYPQLAAQANEINTYFSDHVMAFMLGPAIISGTLLYFHWNRTELSWADGLLIEGKSVDLVYYHFKSSITGTPLIYLKTHNKLYIVYPATSQDGKKLADGKRMAQETAVNEVQVEILKQKLKHSTATAKRFRFFSTDVIVSFLIFALFTLIAITVRS